MFLIKFQCILYDSEDVFSCFSNFYELKRRDLVSGGNQFCRTAELFSPLFCISVLKVSRTQVLFNLLDFNAFSMIQEEVFSDFWNFYKLRRGDLICWGERILQNGWLIWSLHLYFNFKSFTYRNLRHSLDLNAFCIIQE